MRKRNLSARKGLPPHLGDGVAVLTVLLPMEEPDSITLPDQLPGQMAFLPASHCPHAKWQVGDPEAGLPHQASLLPR